MERLTSSPHVVDLFAYCGNSIVTEFAPYDLETALQQRHFNSNSNDTSGRGGGVAVNPRTTTPSEKLELALQAAMAVLALHENDIIHADLTSQQFLVFPSSSSSSFGGGSPILKINDFNRCRFAPHKIQTDDGKNEGGSNGEDSRCMVRIPSAPGLYRSPEEYELQPLTPQIDVFSLGHVLYEIVTGTKPWKDMMGKRLRQAVQDGQLMRRAALETAGTPLGGVIPGCYILDPHDRPTAQRLVDQLRTAIKELDSGTSQK
jgi:serine/threonine protein kinase